MRAIQQNLFTRAEQLTFGPPPPPEIMPDLASYDRIVVLTSGGRDSTACYLHLRDLDVSPEIVELHHHHVDGQEGSTLFDWPVTPSYVNRFAAAFNLRLTRSWRKHGIEGEMFRQDTLTQPVVIELGDGRRVEVGGDRGDPLTRWKYPAVGPIRKGRYCSPKTKIDPFRIVLTTDPRFEFSRTLVISGERREESPARRDYAVFSPHECDLRHNLKKRRLIDHWRPIHRWTRHHIWNKIREHGVVPHPCYYIGVGRCSCRYCVFSDPNQLATLRFIDPEGFAEHAGNEQLFKHTVHQHETLNQRANRGRIYPQATPERVRLLMSRHYDGEIRVDTEEWVEPAGAFTDSAGPD